MYKKVPLPDKETFAELYNSITRKEIADLYGVSESAIARWRVLLDAPRKKQKWKDNNIELTPRQLDIVIGSMLGDGSIGKNLGKNRRSAFIEEHGAEQKDYCYWKYKELYPLSTKFVEKTTPKVVHSPSGKMTRHPTEIRLSYCASTMKHPVFSELEKVWYARNADGSYIFNSNGMRIKRLPDELNINELALSVWWFDDGSHCKKDHFQATFNTQGFTKPECARLCKYLSDYYSIGASVNRNRGKYIIHVLKKSYDALLSIVSKHCPCKSMASKIGLEENDTETGQ